MPAPDPFQTPARWRLLLPLTAVLGIGLVVLLMGLVSPGDLGSGGDDLRATILQDQASLQRAVEAFVRDTHAPPAASFDLSEGVPSALSDARLVPFARQENWRGPYLSPGLARPTPASFWSLADPEVSGPETDGMPACVWGRLHRGYGEIDDATAQYVDQVLDDGQPGRGAVQVTDTWIWFRLADVPASGSRH